MSFISKGGSADVTVLSGQSITIASLGAGQTRISYSSTSKNYPPFFTPSSIVAQGTVTLGPFAADQPIRIDASFGCDVEYGVGVVPQLSQQSSPDAQNGLTAHAGGGQASALQLRAAISRVTTVATGNDSVKLPPATVGQVRYVANNAAANSMNVFPQSGEQINALGADAAFAMAAGKNAVFFCAVAGQWNAVLSA